MKTLGSIKEEYAEEKGFLSWADLYNRTPPYNIERHWTEIAERYAKEALKEAAEKIERKISTLNSKKIEYRKIDDQYSWHIADDQQCLWKEAKSILNIELK